MISDTTESILLSAQECFFRHGYGATNIAMISRHSKISRVTIHKRFGSKERLFRCLIQQHMHEIHENFPNYIAEHDSIWKRLEHMLLDCGSPLFDEITDQWVRDDLVQACTEHCEDIKSEHFTELEKFSNSQFIQAEQGGQISLKRLSMSTEELASSLVMTTKGLFTTAPIAECRQQLLRILAIYKAATQP